MRLYATGVSVASGADITEDTLQTFTVAAGQLANVGDTLHVVAGGVFAGAGTDTRTARLKFGVNNLSAVQVTAAASTKWSVEAWIIKTGSNTQSYVAVGTTNSAVVGTNNGTLTVTDTGTIAVAVSGQNATTATAGSVTAQAFIVEFNR